MHGSKTSLGFLVLLSMVLFIGTSSGECGDDPARGGGEREEVVWVMSREGMGAVSVGFLETFTGVAPPPPPLPLPGPFSPRSLLRLLAGSPGQNRGDLDEVVMPGIWAVTLGEEGAGTRQEIGLKPPKGPDCPLEVGAVEPGDLGPVGHPVEKRPRPAPKARPPAPTCATERPFCSSISRPLKDQRSFYRP